MSTHVQTLKEKRGYDVATMIKIALLSGIGFLFMYFDFPLPLLPTFLKLDLGDVPAVIGTIAFGPLAGVIIELLKNVLILVFKTTSTGGIGELANFVVGASFVVPLGLVMKSKKLDQKSAIIGFIIAVVSMVVVAAISNYYFFIPAFAAFYHAPVESFVEMAKSVNGLVSDYKTLILLAIVPFNVIKGFVISVIGYYLYSHLKNKIL